MAEVGKNEVARYYIECELDNIIMGENIQLRKDTYSSNISRLLEALSFTYRANGVFDYIESGKYRWEKRIVTPDEITLTGMGEHLTDIIYSDEVQKSPLKFVDYIKSHPGDDRFSELHPRTIPQSRQMVILREDEGVLKMLDGSHRLLSMVMNGVKGMNAYVAVVATDDAKPVIGDAIFLRLRKLWQQTEDPLFRDSIENTIVGMIKATSNGEQSVNAYWIKMAPNEKIRITGQLLIEKSKS
jgi:hypothetical protein